MLEHFQPVLPALTTILTHIDAQRSLQDALQARTTDGQLTDAHEASLRVYDDKIAKQALLVRRSLLDQATTAYTPSAIPGAQYSIDEISEMERVLEEKMQQRRNLLGQFAQLALPVSRGLGGQP
ncbi:hypothetical protein NliqN6_2740 [Naganishia liquefaciens]|uniref:Uncharacterized protein n=1 Tax=Naganishia liquefaciens TaxID=104408 RepID=A0A8H3TSJ1_9TREE|nr:hypothetical protein NliqN6_2740 [Naganishia liquefaciens]